MKNFIRKHQSFVSYTFFGTLASGVNLIVFHIIMSFLFSEFFYMNRIVLFSSLLICFALYVSILYTLHFIDA